MIKNKINYIFLIIPLFILVMVFVLPVQAEETGCCEISPSPGNPRAENLTKDKCKLHNISGADFNSTGKFHANQTASDDKTKCIDKEPYEYKGPSKIIPPQLSVSVPGFGKFSEVNCNQAGEQCQIPWLAEYIGAIYNYSVKIIGILAVIVIMIGGVLWLTAGGNKEKFGEAKKWIGGGVTGLVIALCSYALLIILNPSLVILRPTNISYIDKEDLYELDLDLSKTADELGISEQALLDLKAENPYQAGCHNLAKCKEFGDTRPPGLVEAEAKYGSGPVNPKSYEAFKKALNCVDPNKIRFKIGNSQRTAKRQIELKAEKGKMAASPCCSNHGSGLAMDIDRADGVKMSWDYNEKPIIKGGKSFKTCMNENGLYAKLDGRLGCSIDEPWHWSPSGN